MDGLTVAALRDHIIRVRESCMSLNEFVENFVQASGLNANDVIHFPSLFGYQDRTSIQCDGFYLNKELLRIFNKVMSKLQTDPTNPFHMFVSGAAGTGKTLLLKALRDEIRSYFHSDQESCIVTTFTFTGARSIDGSTIYTTFLISPSASHDPWQRSPHKRINLEKRLKFSTKVVLIDNINFVDATLILSIDKQLRRALDPQKPFGGVSIVLFGDLFQMPPINGLPIWRELNSKVLWNHMNLEELTKNEKVTNPDDMEMFEVLRSGGSLLTQAVVENLKVMCAMKGETVEDVVEELRTLKIKHPNQSFAVLTNTNSVVEQIITLIFAQLGSKRIFKAKDIVHTLGPTEIYNLPGKYEKKDLELSIGSQVSLTSKFQHLTYGAVGRVVEFTEDIVTVQFSNGMVPITRCGWYHTQHCWKQFPLAIAEAFTFHNCQEVTVDGVILFGEIDTRYVYTALSRAKSLKLCRITPNHILDNLAKRDLEKEKDEMRRMRNCNS